MAVVNVTDLCVLCDEKCDSSQSLDYHLKTVHMRLFVCTKCPNFTTMIKEKLTRHLASDHNQTPLTISIIKEAALTEVCYILIVNPSKISKKYNILAG